MGQTPYVETEILLAVMEGRDEDATEKLRSMFPGEARALRRACDRVISLYWDISDNEGFRSP